MALSLPIKRSKIFDPIRKKWVVATPEEIVRQKCLSYLTLKCQFPAEIIAVEKKLSELPHLTQKELPERRVDILCYGPKLAFPLLLIECKATSLEKKMLFQLWGYNRYVKAPFVALVNQKELKMSEEKNRESQYGSCIPTYKDLLGTIGK